MATEKQIAANQKNALNSTGPKTAKGKASVRHNALKHGLLAKDIFIGGGDGREDPEEYATLFEELRDAFQIDGRFELLLLEKIVLCYWRMRRSARAEVGALRRKTDDLVLRMNEAAEDALQEDLKTLNQDLASFSAGLLSYAGGPSAEQELEASREEARRRLRKTPLGVRHLLATVDAALAEVGGSAELSGDTREQLEREFGQGMNGDKAHLPKLLTEERDELGQLLEEAERRFEEGIDAALADASLPSDEDIQRIQRYETANERQLYAALHQLERVQGRRRGELSLPPISVEVTQKD